MIRRFSSRNPFTKSSSRSSSQSCWSSALFLSSFKRGGHDCSSDRHSRLFVGSVRRIVAVGNIDQQPVLIRSGARGRHCRRRCDRRRGECRKKPRIGHVAVAAAHRTMDEVGGALISIALTLCAVFVPSAFLSGITGLFFRQFAVTIAASTVISCLSPSPSARRFARFCLAHGAELRAARSGTSFPAPSACLIVGSSCFRHLTGASRAALSALWGWF